MTHASPRRPLGRISGLVVFAVAMAALVLAIALGANMMFNRSFGASPDGKAATHERAASSPAAESAPARTASPANP